MNTKKSSPKNSSRQVEQTEERSASEKQQRFAKVVAIVLAGALALSFVAPAIASLFV